MYITYASDQVSMISKHRPSSLKKQTVSDFRPTWLVRVDDMVRVPGAEAKNEGYCTLSYSWSYSGDIETDEQGESTYTDRKQHKIIVSKKITGEHQQQARHVEFEKVVQQICKDFHVKYIWFDKKCIDQDNKVEKQKEIKQMHKIYRNANYTLALIPELQIPDSIKRMDWTVAAKYWIKRKFSRRKNPPFIENDCFQQSIRAVLESEWSKRLWTLEEAVMSRHIVFVGTNAHIWVTSKRLYFASLLFPSFRSLNAVFSTYVNKYAKKPNANAILRQAHSRTTTKDHDHAFALANIFADKLHVDIDYDLPSEVVVNQFYARLAAVDQTILCFGKPVKSHQNTISKKYNLPSWTGIQGIHVQGNSNMHTGIACDLNGCCSIDDKMRMYLQNVKFTVYNPVVLELTPDEKEQEMHLYCGTQPTHYMDGLVFKATRRGIMAVERSSTGELHSGAIFSLTEACDECIILDIPFFYGTLTVFPVVKKVEENIYKSIGIFFLLNVDVKNEDFHLPSFCGIKEGSFTIV